MQVIELIAGFGFPVGMSVSLSMLLMWQVAPYYAEDRGFYGVLVGVVLFWVLFWFSFSLMMLP